MAMVDTLTPRERSERMARIKAKNTTPEMKLRKLVYGMGFRYRIHDRRLPGRPDLVFQGRRAVIFIHGCFWHRHSGCRLARIPKSNVEFWSNKLEKNRLRDARNIASLEALGWRVLVIWECEIKNDDRMKNTIKMFLD